MTTFSWAALCKQADPTKPRIVTYRFGDRLFYEPFDKDNDRPYTRWAIGVGYWAITTGTHPPFTVGPFVDIERDF